MPNWAPMQQLYDAGLSYDRRLGHTRLRPERLRASALLLGSRRSGAASAGSPTRSAPSRWGRRISTKQMGWADPLFGQRLLCSVCRSDLESISHTCQRKKGEKKNAGSPALRHFCRSATPDAAQRDNAAIQALHIRSVHSQSVLRLAAPAPRVADAARRATPSSSGSRLL